MQKTVEVIKFLDATKFFPWQMLFNIELLVKIL